MPQQPNLSPVPPISAGDFTTWLELTREPTGAGFDVPCGDCTACCRSSYFIHIQSHETAVLDRIPDELLFSAPGLPDGNVVMGYDENGQCPMFVNGGCSIYDDRPQTCRDYDCRVFAATGLELDDDKQAEIIAQTQRWKFDTPTDLGRAQQTALLACANYLRAHSDHLPAGSVPSDPNHLALIAIDIHEVFIDRHPEPDLDRVSDALDAAMKKRRSG